MDEVLAPKRRRRAEKSMNFHCGLEVPRLEPNNEENYVEIKIEKEDEEEEAEDEVVQGDSDESNDEQPPPEENECSRQININPYLLNLPSISINPLDFEVSEIDLLRKDNVYLKQTVQKLYELNVSLQHTVIEGMKEIKEQQKQSNNCQAQNSAGYPPVGSIRKSDKAVHLGRNIFLEAAKYHRVLNASKTESKFMLQMAVAIFGKDVLQASSVFGFASNRLRGAKAVRPALDSTKLLALQDIYRHWLMTAKKYDSVQVDAFVCKMPNVLAKKIAQLNDKK